MLVTATCGALFVPDIVTVWALLGSSVAVLVAFVLPTLFYLAIRAHKPWRGKKGAAPRRALRPPRCARHPLSHRTDVGGPGKGRLVDPTTELAGCNVGTVKFCDVESELLASGVYSLARLVARQSRGNGRRLLAEP